METLLTLLDSSPFSKFRRRTGPEQHNKVNLKRFALHLFPFLEECNKVNKWYLEAFSSHYYYSSCDCHTGQKSEVSFKDTIEYRDDFHLFVNSFR